MGFPRKKGEGELSSGHRTHALEWDMEIWILALPCNSVGNLLTWIVSILTSRVILTLWDRNFFAMRRWPVNYRLFCSKTSLYPLDASSTPKPYSQLWQPKLSSDYQLPSLGAGGQNHSHMRIIDLASLSFSALNYNPKTIIIKMSTSSGSEGWWDTCILMWHRAWHTVRWSINITCCYYYSINQGIEICVTAPLAYQILSWKFNSANKYWRSISTGILPATGNHRLNKI